MKKSFHFHRAHRASMCRWVGSLAILLFATGPAREAAASPLVYEGFQYAVGTTLPTMSGGFGWFPGQTWTGSSQMSAQSPTLSYPTALPSTGNTLSNSAAGEAWRYFAAPFNNAVNDLWISFQEESTTAAPGAFVDIMPVSGTDIQVNKDGFGAITLNGSLAGFSAGFGNVDFFVVQISQFTGITWVNLFLNPAATLGPPSASFPIPSVFQLNQFYYRSNMGELLDEIRVGTTPQDAAAVTLPSPTLTITNSGTGQITISWPNYITGYSLQEKTNLTQGSWVASATGPTNPAVITVVGSQKFYQLENNSSPVEALANTAPVHNR
jgi:hypothetical protein